MDAETYHREPSLDEEKENYFIWNLKVKIEVQREGTNTPPPPARYTRPIIKDEEKHACNK